MFLSYGEKSRSGGEMAETEMGKHKRIHLTQPDEKQEATGDHTRFFKTEVKEFYGNCGPYPGWASGIPVRSPAPGQAYRVPHGWPALSITTS